MSQDSKLPSQADILADNEALHAKVATLTKQVGELTAQLTTANGELATLRPKAEDAAKQAAAIIAAAGITGLKDKAASGPSEKPDSAKKPNLTEQILRSKRGYSI